MDKLTELEKRAEKLTKQYRGQIVNLKSAKKAAKKSTREAQRVEGQLGQVQTQLAQLAAARYMSESDPTAEAFGGGEGGQGSGIEYLARTSGTTVEGLRNLTTRAQTARQQADAKVKQLEQTIKALEARRGEVEKMLNKFKPQSPMTGSSGVTPRMKTLRDAIDRRFGPFRSIGCVRANAGEHTSGRACDFMESAGTMPSADRQAHGDKVSQWAIDNASKYGVMYIIWKQRIYDLRAGGGWEQMSDRGSITQNHFDHVHISVL